MISATTEYEKTALEFFLKKYGVSTSGITVALARNSRVVGKDDGLTVPKSATEFVIFIREDHPNADLVRVIAHEAAHVAQLVNGSLTFKKVGGNINAYWHDELVDVNKVSYRRRPWEIEAFTLEKKYLHDFINKYGNNIKESIMTKIKTFEEMMGEANTIAKPAVSVAQENDIEKAFKKVFGQRLKAFKIDTHDAEEGFVNVTATVAALNYTYLKDAIKRLKAAGLTFTDSDFNNDSCDIISSKNILLSILEFYVDLE